ncbi:MAG TPA: DEAD/DEAH box helicase [Acidimicrobiia bacterium]|nr:DEAD/DEAH box helicase [Acidimicrobiia bacterium]HZQ78707.1 DEAD/DEAH box helicase [Acidimicrobiia bacterium]
MSNDAGFGTIGVSPDLCDALAAQGISEPFPIQILTMPAALAGRDICGKAKTGSGKTLAFGIAAIERTKPAAPRHPRALVLVPTRELAMQVAGVLAPLATVRDLTVVTVYGGDSTRKQAAALGRKGDIVVATPGRLIDFLERGEIYLDEIDMVVLDEADRMADMGFTPQVTWILRHLGDVHPQTMLFSATLDGDVDHLVKKYLVDPVHHEVESDQPTVDLMEHRFLKVHQMDKVNVAASIINGAERCLVFVRTKRGADRVASDLRRAGVKVGVIHGDLPQKTRSRAMADFGSGAIRALVATDVAARGLDVKGVDVVLHYDPAEDHKAYLHRSGRTARAGKTGVAVSLVLWDQEREAEALQRRLGIAQPVIEVFSNDVRLEDLAGWDPAADAVDTVPEAEAATGTDGAGPAAPPPPSASLRPKPGPARRRRRML